MLEIILGFAIYSPGRNFGPLHSKTRFLLIEVHQNTISSQTREIMPSTTRHASKQPRKRYASRKAQENADNNKKPAPKRMKHQKNYSEKK